MKKKLKIINLLVLLGIFASCNDQLEVGNSKEFSTVSKKEALRFLTNSKLKDPNSYILNVDIEKLKAELISNSDEQLMVVPIQTKDTGYYSRLVMLKINDEVKAKIVHFLKKDAKTTDFTGEVILSDLEGRFYAGGWFENNLLTKNYTFNTSTSAKTDSAECRQECGHSADNEHCVCNTQNLGEVVIVVSKPTPYVSITTIYTQELGGGSVCESDCGGWPPGGGQSSGSTDPPTCGENEELDVAKENCICKEGYTRDSQNKCVKKPCKGDPVEQLEIVSSGSSGKSGGTFGCTRTNKNDTCEGVKGKKHHDGVDIKSDLNSNVFSMHDGKVTLLRNTFSPGEYTNRSYGNYVVVTSEINGVTFNIKYNHLNQVYVKVGDEIKAGQIIGLSGNTGNANPPNSNVTPHVHIQVYNSDWTRRINPLGLMNTKFDSNFNSINNNNCN